MAYDTHTNLSYSIVATAPSPAASGTSLTVASGQGSRFVAPCNATVWATGEIPTVTNAEIVRITAVVGDVLTITRAQEGTSARTIVVGDQIANTITAKVLTDVEAAVDVVSAALSNELSVRAAKDDSLSNQISVVSSALSNETSARVAQGNTLSQAISVVSQAVSIVSVAAALALNNASVVSAAQATTSAELTSVKDRVSALSAKLSTDLSAISQAHSALSQAVSVANAALSVRIDTQSNAISVLSAKLSAEISAISQAHSALSQAVSVADAALSVRVDTVSNAVSVLSAKLSTEISAISQAHSALSQAHSATSARLASIMSLLDAGTTGQVLKKQSNADFDFAWDTDLTAGGGGASATVTSANISALSNRLSILSAKLSTEISAISQAHSALSQAHSVLSADVVSVKDRVSANSALLSTVASALSARIDTVSNAVSVVSSLVSTVASALSVRIDTVSQAHSALSALGPILLMQNTDTSTVSAGQPVYAELSAGASFKFLRANGFAGLDQVGSPFAGIVIDSAISVSATGRVQTDGLVSLTSTQWSEAAGAVSGHLQPGDLYYMSPAVAGRIVAGTPSGDKAYYIGVAVSKEHLLIRPMAFGDPTQALLSLVSNISALSQAHSALSARVASNSALLSTVASALSQQISVLSAKLSTEISAISQAHSVLSADHVSLKDRVSGISAAVSVLSADVTSVKDRVSGISAAVSSLSADVTSVKDRVSGISAAVSSLSADVTSVKDRVSANSALLSTVASALSARIDTVSNGVSVVSSLVSTVASALSVRIDTVSNLVSALTSAHNALSNTVSALSVGPGGTAQYLSLQNLDSVTVSAGAPVYLWSTISSTGQGAFKLADASATGGARRPIGIIVDGSVAVSAVARVQTRDSVSLTSAQWNDIISGATSGLSAGMAYYLDTNRGKLTLSMPSGSNAGVIVGYAVNQTELRLVGPNALADWLSDSISVGTATAADLSNKISVLSAKLSTEISALSNNISILSATLSTTASALSARIDTVSNAVSVLSAGLGSPQLRWVSTANTVTGSAVTNISGLSVSVAAGGTYQVQGAVLFNMSAVTTTGIGFGLSYPTMAAAHGRWEGNFGSINNPQWNFNGVSTFSVNPGTGAWAKAYFMESAAQAQTNVVVLSAAIPGASAGRTYMAKVSALMNVSAAGTVQVVCRQPQNEIVVLKGSYIRAYKIV